MVSFRYRQCGVRYMSCKELNKAKMLLDTTINTCVFCSEHVIITDRRRGVRPLLDLLESNADVVGFAVADKVVGKAAAFLYCLLKIKCLYARVISQPALSVLRQAEIKVEYGQLVPSIQNRSKDGPCPIESAVLNVLSPEDALPAIYKALVQLNK